MAFPPTRINSTKVTKVSKLTISAVDAAACTVFPDLHSSLDTATQHSHTIHSEIITERSVRLT